MTHFLLIGKYYNDISSHTTSHGVVGPPVSCRTAIVLHLHLQLLWNSFAKHLVLPFEILRFYYQSLILLRFLSCSVVVLENRLLLHCQVSAWQVLEQKEGGLKTNLSKQQVGFSVLRVSWSGGPSVRVHWEEAGGFTAHRSSRCLQRERNSQAPGKGKNFFFSHSVSLFI